MKNFKWQKYVFSACLLVGILVLLITKEPLVIGVSGVIGLILHFLVAYFFPPKDNL